MKRTIILILAIWLVSAPYIYGATPIMGDTELSVERMYQFVKSRNSDFQREIAETFHRVGNRYGIRGDIALCQAILETGWFRFSDGTAVDGQQFNYCGLGVLAKGMKGCAFSGIDEGVTAQIQHLYAYASKAPLPDGETLVDPRFGQVIRGCAKDWEKLSGRWAANNRYAERILKLYRMMCEFDEAEVITVGIPDDLFDSLIDGKIPE